MLPVVFFLIFFGVGFLWVRGVVKSRIRLPGWPATLIIAAAVIASSSAISGVSHAPAIVVANIAFLSVWWANRRDPGITVAAIGGLMNLAVISANGGRMPTVMPDIFHGRLPPAYVPLDAGTRIALLADHILVRLPHGGIILSPGDLVVLSGLALFCIGQLAAIARSNKDP